MRPTATLVLAATLAGCAAPAQPSRSADEATAPAQMIDRYVAMKNAHDASHLADLFASGYVEHSGRSASGLDALAQNWTTQFAAIPDLRVEVQDVVAGGDRVVARTLYRGTHTTPFLPGLAPTGRAFSFGTIDIWRVEGGKFVEHWDQVDFAGLQRQLAAKTP